MPVKEEEEEEFSLLKNINLHTAYRIYIF